MYYQEEVPTCIPTNGTCPIYQHYRMIESLLHQWFIQFAMQVSLQLIMTENKLFSPIS